MKQEKIMDLIRDDISLMITESVKKLAQEKSAGRITVRDILKDLGITNRVFYNRFHNIDEVMDILYSESVSRVRESLSMPWDGKTDFGEHILDVASKTLTLTYESRRNMSQYIFEADSVTNTNFEWWNQEIMKLIAKGKEIGFIRKDLEEDAVSYSMWCFIRGFNADALARDLPEDEAVKQFRYGLSCFLKGMRP